MASIDNFLKEYRDYMYTRDLLLSSLNEESSPSDIYVITNNSVELLLDFYNNMLFLDKNLVGIEKEISTIFQNVYGKINRIEEIAESYQNLNTNELSEDTIKSFKAFNITQKDIYDSYYEALTLPRKSKVTAITAKAVNRANKSAKEVYTGFEKLQDTFIKVKVLEDSKTILKKIEVRSKTKELILEVYGKSFIKIPKDAFQVVVITDNEEENSNYYTRIDVLEDKFSPKAFTTLTSENFLRGSKFKLNLDFKLPTACYATLKIDFKFKNNKTLKYENITLYASLNTDLDILVPKSEAKPGASLKDIYGNVITDYKTGNEELVFSPNYSSNELLINQTGNKVFDISKIKSDNFSVTLSIALYSLTDETKTPEIKGVFGYVTE